MKVEERKHQSFCINYKSFKFIVSQPEIGAIKIEFQDEKTAMKHISQKILENISYKTVVTALKEEETNIIKSKLICKPGSVFQLKINVCLEYLNQIQEIFVFKKEKLSQKRLKVVRQMNKNQKQIEKLKDEINQISGTVCFSGKIINNPAKNKQIFIKIPYDTTVISFSLNFNKISSNLMKLSFNYYDDISQSILPHNALPQEQMYIDNSSYISVVAHKSNFKKGVFKIQGDFDELNYTITCQEVIDHTPTDWKKVILRTFSVFIILGIGYCLKKWIYGGSSGESQL